MVAYLQTACTTARIPEKRTEVCGLIQINQTLGKLCLYSDAPQSCIGTHEVANTSHPPDHHPAAPGPAEQTTGKRLQQETPRISHIAAVSRGFSGGDRGI